MRLSSQEPSIKLLSRTLSPSVEVPKKSEISRGRGKELTKDSQKPLCHNAQPYIGTQSRFNFYLNNALSSYPALRFVLLGFLIRKRSIPLLRGCLSTMKRPRVVFTQQLYFIVSELEACIGPPSPRIMCFLYHLPHETYASSFHLPHLPLAEF